MNNKIYWLALNRIPQVGPRLVAKILSHWPNLEALFKAPIHDLQHAGLSTPIAQAIANFNFNEIDADLKWEQYPSHFLLTLDDPNYPALLKEIYDPPTVLYAIGDITCLQQPTLGIVGTRKPSMIGGETAWRFAFELAQQMVTIVSGLALGIDGQAHRGCLEANGKTIAVMGTGIDKIYPYRHQSLAEKIKENGLLISELTLGSAPAPGHFPRRNRIISGLSLAILVVEAAIRSGSLITARMALEQNRDVLAIPGSIQNPQARGCHYLLQQGAKLVTSTAEVLEELSLNSAQMIDGERFVLASDNKNLVKFIDFEVTSVDRIQERSGLSIEVVTCELVDLELQGMVIAVPGGYVRCSHER